MGTFERILASSPGSHYVTPHPSAVHEDTSAYYFNMAARTRTEQPFQCGGSGVVMCAGGEKYLLNAWINVRTIRHHGCDWPIQIWHLGKEEIPGNTVELFSVLGVEFIDGRALNRIIPIRIMNGWELKVYALKYTTFRDIMFLDADSFCTRRFEFLFDSEEYRKTGCIFWPDQDRWGRDRAIWSLVDVDYRDRPEIEAGQMCIDKDRCWHELCLAMWMNNYSDFYYRYINGDKDTFFCAFNKTNRDYTMGPPLTHLDGIGFNHRWFDTNSVFQHRNWNKYSLTEPVKRGEMIDYELHLTFLEEFRQRWRKDSLRRR